MLFCRGRPALTTINLCKQTIRPADFSRSLKLLENGERWEAEIARNLELDAPYR